jgi:CotH kinase protein
LGRSFVSGLVLAISLVGVAGGCQNLGRIGPPADDGDDGDGDGIDVDAGADPDGGEEPCTDDENLPPAAPALLTPQDDLIDVVPDSLVIEASAFSDPDGETHARSEFAIWRTAGGEPVVRVWSAAVDDPDKLTRVTLADGSFEVGDALDLFAKYQVVARYSDGAACSAWSAWSGANRFRTQDGSTYWFDPEAVRDVYIEIPPASWDPINAQASPPGCVPFVREYYPGSAVLDGVRYDGIGVRTKGGCGSSRNLGGKASFKLNLSWNDPAVPGCPEERRSHGLKRFTLNNLVQDRSYVHERLAYRFYQLMDVPAARAAHTRVHVNDQLWGLYDHIESFDRRFLARWFEDNDGMLYEGTYWCDLVPGNVPPADEDTYCISRKFHPSDCEPPAEDGDPEDYGPIRAMVQELTALVDTLDDVPPGSFYPEVASIIDFDRFLSMWAVDTIIGHWDGYVIRIRNNYRVYHDPETDLWTFIPSGVDQTFGQGLQAQERNELGWLAGLVADRCWDDPECKAAFLDRLEQAVDIFEQADLGTLATSIAAHIGPVVENEDPRKEGSYAEFQNRVNDTISFIDARAAEIRAQIAAYE